MKLFHRYQLSEVVKTLKKQVSAKRESLGSATGFEKGQGQLGRQEQEKANALLASTRKIRSVKEEVEGLSTE